MNGLWWCSTCGAPRDPELERCQACDGVARQSFPPGQAISVNEHKVVISEPAPSSSFPPIIHGSI